MRTNETPVGAGAETQLGRRSPFLECGTLGDRWPRFTKSASEARPKERGRCLQAELLFQAKAIAY